MAAHDWDFLIWQRANDLLQQAERIRRNFFTSRRRCPLSGIARLERAVNVVETDKTSG